MIDRTPTDQATRDRIAAELSRNTMVIAGAGSGKTTALTERMVRCVASGHAEVGRMAGITFTNKAATEMRDRFHDRLREAAGETSGLEARRLRGALERIDGCFIGTIHAFCAQLLRKRPLEAGLPPDFTEVDEREERALRTEAWHRFLQHGLEQRDERLERLEALGLRARDLFDGFETRGRFDELSLKADPAERPDLEPAAEAAVAFIRQASAHIPDPLSTGADPVIEALLKARCLLMNRGLTTDGDRIELLSLLDARSATSAVKLKSWRPNEAYARSVRDDLLPQLQKTVLKPALSGWRRYLYPRVAGLLDEATVYYENERRLAGKVTFQDLLTRTSALVRDHPSIRKTFQNCYQCLFVDEFQDTDPVQAELLLYLTGEDLAQRDWRRLKPRPGSLFIVGDEMQSIYRFRRADVKTFRWVRNRVEETSGQVLRLDTSFRSLGRLCDWINRTFSSLFSEEDPRYQAEFAPISKVRTDGDDPVGVRRISIDAIPHHARGEVASRDADRIADFIAAALEGETEFNGSGPGAILAGRADPCDFMILTSTRSLLGTYARALEMRGIPYDVMGKRLGDVLEFRALVEMLASVYEPENPVPLVAYLRGPFVGLGDDELYAFSRAGGAFNYRVPLSTGVSDERFQRFRDAFERLGRAERWLKEKTVAAALERVADDLGIVPFSAASSEGSSRAGCLLRVFALVKRWEDAGMHWGRVLSELRTLIEAPSQEIEGMTLETGQENVVRLMNLHQAKGLEANVVFLADPADRSFRSHGVEFHVSRTGRRPLVSLPIRRKVGEFREEIIAEPEGWTEDASEETRFLEAEDLRLLYVAATRARNLLVVSCYAGRPEDGPWAPLYPFLRHVPELPAARPAAPTPTDPPVTDEAWRRLSEDRAERWRAVRQPTVGLGTLSGEDDPEADMFQTSGGRGVAYGKLIHRLFEGAVRHRLPDDEKRYIRHLLAVSGLDGSLTADVASVLAAFRASDEWREIQASGAVHTEVPLAAADGRNGGREVVRGRIDLIYRLPEGWKIIDYKTDTDVAGIPDRYADQLKAYASHWRSITGEPVAASGFWITGIGVFREISQN